MHRVRPRIQEQVDGMALNMSLRRRASKGERCETPCWVVFVCFKVADFYDADRGIPLKQEGSDSQSGRVG